MLTPTNTAKYPSDCGEGMANDVCALVLGVLPPNLPGASLSVALSQATLAPIGQVTPVPPIPQ